jgi:hypothetical protein
MPERQQPQQKDASKKEPDARASDVPKWLQTAVSAKGPARETLMQDEENPVFPRGVLAVRKYRDDTSD